MTRRYILPEQERQKAVRARNVGLCPSHVHVRHIRMAGDMSDNKMERQNGEVGDREKTMRGLKDPDSPMLKGYQIFHNYIRTHEGLDGKTPAEAAGITVEGENKWLAIIQNASKKAGGERRSKLLCSFRFSEPSLQDGDSFGESSGSIIYGGIQVIDLFGEFVLVFPKLPSGSGEGVRHESILAASSIIKISSHVPTGSV